MPELYRGMGLYTNSIPPFGTYCFRHSVALIYVLLVLCMYCTHMHRSLFNSMSRLALMIMSPLPARYT